MNDVDNHHAFKMANYHTFVTSLNHLSLYYMCVQGYCWLLPVGFTHSWAGGQIMSLILSYVKVTFLRWVRISVLF